MDFGPACAADPRAHSAVVVNDPVRCFHDETWPAYSHQNFKDKSLQIKPNKKTNKEWRAMFSQKHRDFSIFFPGDTMWRIDLTVSSEIHWNTTALFPHKTFRSFAQRSMFNFDREILVVKKWELGHWIRERNSVIWTLDLNGEQPGLEQRERLWLRSVGFFGGGNHYHIY